MRKPNDSQYLHDEQTIEPESDREKKSKKRKRIDMKKRKGLIVLGKKVRTCENVRTFIFYYRRKENERTLYA